MPLLGLDPFARERGHLVETHNNDLMWYRMLRESSSNPLTRLTAKLSERWSTSIVRSYQSTDILFLHLTDTDREGYLAVAPNHRSIITPIGVVIPEEPPVAQPSNADVRLLFVGSLGVMTNADALAFLGRTYFPALKQKLGNTFVWTLSATRRASP